MNVEWPLSQSIVLNMSFLMQGVCHFAQIGYKIGFKVSQWGAEHLENVNRKTKHYSSQMQICVSV